MAKPARALLLIEGGGSGRGRRRPFFISSQAVLDFLASYVINFLGQDSRHSNFTQIRDSCLLRHFQLE